MYGRVVNDLSCRQFHAMRMRVHASKSREFESGREFDESCLEMMSQAK